MSSLTWGVAASRASVCLRNGSSNVEHTSAGSSPVNCRRHVGGLSPPAPRRARRRLARSQRRRARPSGPRTGNEPSSEERTWGREKGGGYA
jgi:hypothetical protein